MVGDKAWLVVGVPPQMSDEVDVSLLCGSDKFFLHQTEETILLIDLALFTEALAC